MHSITSIRDHCGFYIGRDSALVHSEAFTAVFLRLSESHIITALMQDGRVVSLVSGHRDGKERHVFMMLHASAQRFVRPEAALEELNGLERSLEACTVRFTEDGAVCIFAGQEFPMVLGAPIDLQDIRRPRPVDERLSVAEKMRTWNVDCWYIIGDEGEFVHANISDSRFDCHWEVNVPQNLIYCRLGVSGYCEKGWAMLPTVTLRAHACGMLPDHSVALLPYQPDESCFVPDSCAFPEDGGWYWSVSGATQDVVTLNGCGGATYTIYRPR